MNFPVWDNKVVQCIVLLYCKKQIYFKLHFHQKNSVVHAPVTIYDFTQWFSLLCLWAWIAKGIDAILLVELLLHCIVFVLGKTGTTCTCIHVHSACTCCVSLSLYRCINDTVFTAHLEGSWDKAREEILADTEESVEQQKYLASQVLGLFISLNSFGHRLWHLVPTVAT